MKKNRDIISEKNLDIIGEIINEDYLSEPQNQLIEEKEDVSMCLDIVPGQGRAYKLYRFDEKDEKELFPFFARTQYLRSMCDYILFTEKGKILTILLIELKKSLNNKSQANKQLLAGEEFVLFLLKSAARIGKKIEVEDNQIKLIKIYDKIHDKNKIRANDDDLLTQHDKYFTYNGRKTFLLDEIC
jgi:hypothetical protein